MLHDDKKDEQEINAAIIRLAKAPPVLLQRAEHSIPEEKELEEALALKEIGLISVVNIVKLDDSRFVEVGSYSGDFSILKVFKPMDVENDLKHIHLVGRFLDFPKWPNIKGKYVIV
jgi:hypothetical protein